MAITYISTNGRSQVGSFGEALLQGQAPDRGLYMPSVIPTLGKDTLSSMAGMEYSEIAFTVLNEFLGNELGEGELRTITKDAYDFELPIQKIIDNQYVLWLDEGPTAAFKDFAARMMARLMQYYNEGSRGKLVILVATSGDTGGAVASAFHNLDAMDVIVLFPKNEVTERQRRQMTTLGKNITAIAIDGKFDDCQAFVKQAFADSKLEDIRLTSANSINMGRLLPQAVYYFYGWSRVDDEAIFSVPSGNFGNLMGGLIAKRMGLPVRKFIVATNENDEFPRFVKSGNYEPIVPSRACISNAMNVGHPSNLARLIHMYGGQMDERGIVKKIPDMGAIREDMFAMSITDDETRKTIKNVYREHKVVLEPHGAVGWAALQRFLKEEKTDVPAISFETADPGKFPEEIVRLLKIQPPVPESLRGLDKKEEFMEELPGEYGEFRKFLIGRYIN